MFTVHVLCVVEDHRTVLCILLLFLCFVIFLSSSVLGSYIFDLF